MPKIWEIWKDYNGELGRGGYTKKIRDVAGYKDQMLVRSSELPLQTLPLSHFSPVVPLGVIPIQLILLVGNLSKL